MIAFTCFLRYMTPAGCIFLLLIHTQMKVLFAHFSMHNLTDALNWLVSLYATSLLSLFSDRIVGARPLCCILGSLYTHIWEQQKNASLDKVKGGQKYLWSRNAPHEEQLVAIWRPLGGLLAWLSSETPNQRSAAGTGYVETGSGFRALFCPYKQTRSICAHVID